MDSQPRSRRRSLLFLCQTLPFPPDSGVNIRSYNVLRLLARAFDITALCFYRRAARASREEVARSVKGLSEFAKVEAFPIPQEHSRARFVSDHLLSLARRECYTLRTYASEPYRAKIADVLGRGAIDLVHMDSLDLAWYLPFLDGVPVVCTHHNVESSLLRHRALLEPSRWRRRYLAMQSDYFEGLEVKWCGRVALNVTVSERDRVELAGISPSGRFCVVPNGVDVDTFRPIPSQEEGVCFVGGLGWFPNRDALEYFSREILPIVHSLGYRPPIRWVGQCSDADRHDYAVRAGLELTGYVEDVRPYIAQAACYVVPLRVGGGTRLKILDAWAMGKAVVSTSIGCEGLAAVDGENILVRDSPSGFADAVCSVLADPVLRRRLGENARATVVRSYSWEGIGEELIRLYAPLAGRQLPVGRT